MIIMCYNVLCARWEGRVDAVTSVIRDRRPDTFGLEEAHKGWMDAFSAALPEYGCVGVGRDDGKEEGEYSPVFYLREKYEVADCGHFWLSETPGRPGKGWDAACVRICSWALLRNKRTGEEFAHFSTHTDHRGPKARVEGAKLIVERANALFPDKNVILTGDFNDFPDSEMYKVITTGGFYDTRTLAKDSDVRGTFTDFDNIDTSDGTQTIDYIFTNNKNADVRSFKVIHDRLPDGSAPSDHDAVIADITF
ncbi:MAG: endonuclease/exonuclease/phosphatase family protein [Clostridia bacterium]|nr:endonuclease/exonuclease/phosphatase family protein [Clostridia bacterium]